MSGGHGTSRTFVGFGFGPIQAGLFLYEAFRSGNFQRFVVAEVVPEVVNAVRRAGGQYSVNIAYSDRVKTERIGPVEIADPATEPDRTLLVEAVAEAEEIATALPSVQHYTSNAPGSVHRILAEGLRKKAASGAARAVVYAAENHNRAAEILEAEVQRTVPQDERDRVRSRVRFLNTVIGKMSGVVADTEDMRRRALAAVVPTVPQAFLVESFNRILISRICFEGARGQPAFRRGITVFEEKHDLLPFEEAKLYGHNSTHALAAYIGAFRGKKRIADLADAPGLLAFLEAAFLHESGETLIRRHKGVDGLFTSEGYRDYALDLLARMVNPYLGDTVSRVARDPARKLEWDDRLTGIIRLALHYGVPTPRYALGAAAALALLYPAALNPETPVTALFDALWSKAAPDTAEKEIVAGIVERGLRHLRLWRDCGFPDLEDFINQPDIRQSSSSLSVSLDQRTDVN